MLGFLNRLATFWTEKLHSQVSSFVAFFGVFWLSISLITLYILAKLSEGVLEQEAFAFDKTILLAIHKLSSPVLDTIMLGITRVGDPRTVVPLTLVVLGLLVWKRYFLEAKFFAIDTFGGAALSYFLKLVFSKQRPQLWTSPITETTFSYPSGHALGSIVLYGFLSYILATIYPRYAKMFYLAASLLIVLIGLSRLYLGVHWPTDIVAGYGVGFVWVTVCISLLRLQRLKRQAI
ncbi:MAG: phosphatase PAP2 family protein [Phormidesmis sp.]